jgi:hypothetical protein
MNELMTALEAMIRRVVKEEIEKVTPVDQFADGNFRAALKNYADDHKAEFAALISVGALDQPWFDDAVKSEALAAAETVKEEVKEEAESTDDSAFAKKVANVVCNNGRIEDWFGDAFNNCIESVNFSCDVSVR